MQILYVGDAPEPEILGPLAAIPGCSVLAVDDGDALKAALADSPDVVVVDGRSGLRERLRLLDASGNGQRATPRVVLLGSSDDETDAAALLHPGLDDWILGVPDLFHCLPAVVRRAAERARHLRWTESRYEQAAAALQQSEAWYRTLFDRSPVPMFVFDAQSMAFVAANAAAISQYGHTREEFFTMTPLDIRPSEEVSGFLAGLGTGATGKRGTWTHRRRDGSTFLAEIAAHQVVFAGRPSWLVVAEDVTERRSTEEALRRSEEWYRTLFDAHPSPLWVYDEQTLGFLAVNQTAIEHYGYSRDELLGMTIRDIRPAEDREALERYLAAGRPERVQASGWRHRKKDGTVIDVEVSSHRILFEGRLARLVVADDVTERRRSEEERARLAMAVEQADEAILITDPEGTILYVNPAFERVTGYPRSEACGRNPRILRSGRQDAAFYAQLWSTLIQGETWRGQLTNRRKDGSLYEAEAAISPVRDTAGRLVNYVAVQRDVTHERHLEQQFLQSQKMEAVGRLAGGVAHDFNNLLNVITGYGELLLRRLASEDPASGKVEQILKAADRAAGLVRQLLAFSRRQVLMPKILDLSLVVADLDKMLRRLIGEDVDLRCLTDTDLGTVRADPGQVEQVLMNLVVNARDAMPEGGRVTIETRNLDLGENHARLRLTIPPGPYVLLAVSDTGSGMDEETLAHVFEPFFTTKDQGRGTGLGLSTVYGIVKQSGGHISVYSEMGRGTTFKIYLPRLEAPPARDAPAERSRPPGGDGTETVLLVEDEDMLREMLQETLEGAGYRLLVARNGDDALSLAAAHDGAIQLLLTDVVMPGINGRELAERLSTARAGMRVLYISGYTDEAIVRHGVLATGVAFLGKPFAPDALLAQVRRVLDGGGDATR